MTGNPVLSMERSRASSARMTFSQALEESHRRGCACRPVGWSDRVFAVNGNAVFCYDWTGPKFEAKAQLPNSVKVLMGEWELCAFHRKDIGGPSLTQLFSLELGEEPSLKLSDLAGWSPSDSLRLADLL